MKFKHLIITFFALSAMLSSCVSRTDCEIALEGGIPINLEGAINQNTTKVNAGGFEDGDGLGLYAVNYENSNQTPGTLKDEGNQVDHVKYIFENWKWNPVRPVYYKDINTNVDLYAFYPHAEPSSVSAYNFEVQKDQSTPRSNGKLAGYEASDFLWGKTANVTPTEAAIKIKLNHTMAGAHVIIQEGTGFEEAGDFSLLDKKVLVTNTTRRASINLSNGEVSPIGEAQATGIVMAPQTDGSFRAIVVPQTIQGGKPLFSITIDGTAYSFSKDAAFEYVAGKLSQFTITVNRKFPSGSYELVLDDTQIVDWKEDINTHQGEARQYYCVNVTKPGTLSQLIAYDQKNPKKIRNLKVSGTISDEDFLFMRTEMDILEALNLKESRIVDVYVGELSIRGYSDVNGNKTTFTKREAGYYDDIIPDYAFLNKKTLNYFVFPEKITDIGRDAFSGTSLHGALVLPDDTKNIWPGAFWETNISSVTFSEQTEIIAQSAFRGCGSLTGTLYLPIAVKYIGEGAFEACSFSGNLNLPNSLLFIGSSAFSSAGKFSGGLRIPDNITVLEGYTFSNSGISNHPFTGILDLNNVQYFEGSHQFYGTKFSGELVIPEGVTDVPNGFMLNHHSSNLTSVIFPSTIKTIGSEAFSNMPRLSSVVLPEGLHTIESSAFEGCNTLQSLELPSTLKTIQQNAFSGGHNIGSIISHASIPPAVADGAFNGVPKDNFTVEVPESAILLYQADRLWGEFTRFSSYKDFSISRKVTRTLNAKTSKTVTLRAPANHSWSITSLPEWITASPSSGTTGKTDITITFKEMTNADVSIFELETINNDGWSGTTQYKGRAGEVVFKLDNMEHTVKMAVEQYDYEYGDGDVITLNKATKGDGVDIVFLADCYDAKDIAEGSYLEDIQEAYGYYFAVEPYKTYKEYFNVYMVFGISDDSGMGTVNTIREAKFGSQYSLEGISPNFETCYEYAAMADQDINHGQTLVIMIENTTEYGGICYMWGDGSAVACCPKSQDTYPYDFRGIVQHEAGGHGFGKLADEYIYHNAFIQTCGCACCGHLDDFLSKKALGWYRNLEATADVEMVGWSHLYYNPNYSSRVDIFEGGFYHTRGIFRSEQVSCMNNNIPYFSAISRQAIVERIMDYAGEEFTLEKFYANDSDAFGSTAAPSAYTAPTTTTGDNGKQFAPVYMGDKPEFLK